MQWRMLYLKPSSSIAKSGVKGVSVAPQTPFMVCFAYSFASDLRYFIVQTSFFVFHFLSVKIEFSFFLISFAKRRNEIFWALNRTGIKLLRT